MWKPRSVAASLSGSPKAAYLQFDGVDDVVVVAEQASLDITSAITLEAWIRPDSLANSKSQDRVIEKNVLRTDVSTGDTGCAFGSNGDVQWRARIGGLNRRICGGSLTLGVWQHIAGTYDGSTFTLYIDGAAVASTSRSGSIATNSDPLTFGNWSGGPRPFDGSMDEVRIWNRALSAGEISANRDVELTGTETGLVAYYRFNEGSGQTAADEGATPANDGTLGSAAGADSSDPTWESSGPANQAPQVDAGTDQTITLPLNMVDLDGTVSDDGLPTGALTTDWSLVSGPASGTVQFGDATAVDTSAIFNIAGSYVLQLRADDGQARAYRYSNDCRSGGTGYRGSASPTHRTDRRCDGHRNSTGAGNRE